MKWKVEMGPCEIFVISNEIRCYYWKSMMSSSRGQVLLIHGLSAYSLFQWLRHSPPGEVDNRGLFYSSSLIQQLNRLGIEVYAIDLEGHGLSNHPKKTTMFMSRGLHGCLQDIFQLIRIMNKRHPLLPIIIMGHSIGGLIALRISQEINFNAKKNSPFSTIVCGIILISPFLGSKHSIRFYQPIVKLGGFFYPRLIVTNGMKNSKMNDKINGSIKLPPSLEARCRYPGYMVEKWVSIDQESDPLVHAPYSPIYIGLISDIFEQVHKMNHHRHDSKKDNRVEHASLLILHSPYDPVCPFDSIIQFYNESTVSSRSLVSISDCLHNPLLEETTRPLVTKEILQWINHKFNNLSAQE